MRSSKTPPDESSAPLAPFLEPAAAKTGESSAIAGIPCNNVRLFMRGILANSPSANLGVANHIGATHRALRCRRFTLHQPARREMSVRLSWILLAAITLGDSSVQLLGFLSIARHVCLCRNRHSAAWPCESRAPFSFSRNPQARHRHHGDARAGSGRFRPRCGPAIGD